MYATAFASCLQLLRLKGSLNPTSTDLEQSSEPSEPAMLMDARDLTRNREFLWAVIEQFKRN